MVTKRSQPSFWEQLLPELLKLGSQGSVQARMVGTSLYCGYDLDNCNSDGHGDDKDGCKGDSKGNTCVSLVCWAYMHMHAEQTAFVDGY